MASPSAPTTQIDSPIDLNQLPDYVRRNRELWNKNAADYAIAGERAWSQEPNWGIWGIPEAQAGLLPIDLAGQDVIELGCGTAYVSAWLARREARVVGVEISDAQLATAHRMRQKHGLPVAIVRANAETVPCRDASFDVAISEYGASCGLIRSAGCPRPHGSCARAVNSSSWSAHSCGRSANRRTTTPPRIGCCVRPSGFIVSSGPAKPGWNFTSRMATGFACCDDRGLRLKT